MSDHDTLRSANGRSRAAIALCYFAGLALGCLAWSLIRIPLGETHGIVSAATRNGFNPLNNVVRTAVFALLPALLLLVCFRLNWGGIGDRLRTCSTWERDIQTSRSPAPVRSAGLAAAAILAALLAVNLWGSKALGFDSFHDGESLSAGLSWVQGQVPYRDYVFIHGVLQDPGRAVLSFALFGKSIGSLRAVDHLARALILVLVATFLWQILRGRLEWVLLTLLALSALMASAAIGGERLPFSPVLIQMRELPTLLFLNVVALIARRLEQQWSGRWTMAGLTLAYVLLPVLAYLVSVDRGLFLTAAMLLGIPLILGGRAAGPNDSLALLLVAGAGILLGVVTLIVVLGSGWPAFWEYMTVYFPQHYALIVGLEYPIRALAFFVAQAMLSAAAFVFMALLIRHFSARPEGLAEAWHCFCRRRFLEVTLLTMTAVWFVGALTQADTWHLRLVTLPMYLSLFYVVIRYFLDPLAARTGRTRLLTRLGWACALLLVLAGSIRLLDGKVLANWLPVGVPDARVVPAEMQLVSEYLKTAMRPEDTFFATDSNPSWYYLTGKVCPARFPISYLAAPPSCQREIIQSLESRQVRFVLTAAARESDARTNLLSRKSLSLLNRYVAGTYAPLQRVGGSQIWERTR
ncbi:MAG: hypothetical protein ACE141_12705 [Bryobacteraceae bacterium]